MNDQPVRRRLLVRGRVQGVFFRDSVRDRANTHHVAGWVCNRQDGAVEAVLEGEAGAVAEVIRFCKSGPSRARVEGVEISDEQPQGLSGFEIR